MSIRPTRACALNRCACPCGNPPLRRGEHGRRRARPPPRVRGLDSRKTTGREVLVFYVELPAFGIRKHRSGLCS